MQGGSRAAACDSDEVMASEMETRLRESAWGPVLSFAGCGLLRSKRVPCQPHSLRFLSLWLKGRSADSRGAYSSRMDGKVVTDIFRRFDKNRDGIITAEELLSVLSKLTLDKKDMTQLLKHIDTNGDGKIQYEEFVNWIVKAGSGDGQDQERSSVLEAHVQAAHHKLQRVRDSQTGAKRAEVFVNQLTSEKGRASLAELADKPPKGQA